MNQRKYFNSFSSILSAPFEYVLIGLLLLTAFLYIIFLKTSSKNQIVYVEVSVQRADWWRTPTLIPTKLLTHITKGSTDDRKLLSVEYIRYFIGLKETWETDNDNKSVGTMLLKINASRHNEKLYYANQEILIGNPLALDISQSRLETLITNIWDKKPNDEFVHATIKIKTWTKVEELVSHFKQGQELTDNTGFVYGKILNVTKESAPVSHPDMHGDAILSKDPLVFNATIDLDVLVKSHNGTLIGYDGRPVTIGHQFVLNNPLLYDSEFFIIGIER